MENCPSTEIRKTITTPDGKVFEIIYSDVDDYSALEGKKIESVRAYCFYQDKLVVVHESAGWGIPGGGLDANEGAQEGTEREVLEETNMKIIKMRPVGMHETIRPSGESVFHARMVCLVAPEGDFVEDPAGEVMEIKFIAPSELIQLGDYKWGEMADRMLERAIRFKCQMESELK